MSSNESYRKTFVSIYDDQGEPCGAGQVFHKNYLITCAHVINRAVGRDKIDETQPPSKKQIKFGLPLHPSLQKKFFVAHLKIWGPKGDKFSDEDDYSIFKIVNEITLKDFFKYKNFLHNRHSSNISFYCISSHTWFKGDTSYKTNGDGLVQFQGSINEDFILEQRDSGSPVYDDDTENIIGMVHSKPKRKLVIGYILPVATIINNFLKIKKSKSTVDILPKKSKSTVDILPKMNREILFFHLDENPESLRINVLFDAAHYFYKYAKQVVNEGQWSSSIYCYLLAYSIFCAMGNDYSFRAARVAGRLSWGFIVEGHFDKAINFLGQSEELDKAEAAGNYFMAIQYSLRTRALPEQTKKLAEKFVDQCLDLGLLKITEDKIGKINNQFAINLVKRYLKYMTDEYHKKKEFKEKFSRSDDAKLCLVKSQSIKDKEKAKNYLADAIKKFREGLLPKYVSFCEVERSILDYSMSNDYGKKKNALKRMQSFLLKTNMNISWQDYLLEGISKIADINLLFLGICENLEEDNEINPEVFDEINDALVSAREEFFENTKTENLIGQLGDEIHKLSQNLSDQKIKSRLIATTLEISYKIYKSVPLLFGDYVPILREIINDKFKKSDILIQ